MRCGRQTDCGFPLRGAAADRDGLDCRRRARVVRECGTWRLRINSQPVQNQQTLSGSSVEPVVERRTDRVDRRYIDGGWTGRDRRASQQDRRAQLTTLADVLSALPAAEAECDAADAASAQAEAAWNLASAEYEKAEAAWSEARARHSRARATLARVRFKLDELNRA